MIPNTGTIYYFITLILLCLLFWNPTTLFHPVVQCVKRENLHDHMTLASLEWSRVDLWPKSQKSGSPVVLNIGFNTQTKKLSLPYFQQKLWREVSCKAKMWVKNAQMCFQLCCCCCCCLGKQWWNYRIKPSVLPIFNSAWEFCETHVKILASLHDSNIRISPTLTYLGFFSTNKEYFRSSRSCGTKKW